MNTIEIKMLELLKLLKSKYGVIELKAEFEAEGTRLNELMRLKELATKANLGLLVKIGGAEAITDMIMARDIGITSLVSPMVESSYSVKKYIEAILKYFPLDMYNDVHFGINIETIQAYSNVNEIIKLETINSLHFITLGRGDLCGSLGMTRTQVNDDRIYQVALDAFAKAKEKQLITCLGGGVDSKSIPFIKQLVSKKLLDKFETRKVVFSATQLSSLTEEAIQKSLEFELLWLQNKQNYYTQIIKEDEVRLSMLINKLLK